MVFRGQFESWFPMHLELHPIKNVTRKKGKILFAVVDVDKSERYPNNFVVLLPVNINPSVNSQPRFPIVFGGKSLEIAKQLLTDALKEENDPEIKAEIKRRLRLLDTY